MEPNSISIDELKIVDTLVDIASRCGSFDFVKPSSSLAKDVAVEFDSTELDIASQMSAIDDMINRLCDLEVCDRLF